ncbi:MAG: hypothetical protein LBC35_05775 [Coriobacteriales bacterium]|jgi:predicted  nucleic acid-binding Zn-ribbon protein|nr:hypothetical protein [Coriobacteriales bacterium]
MRYDNPIKGDPAIVRQTGTDYLCVHNEIASSLPKLESITAADQFESDAIDAIRERTANIKKNLCAVQDRYGRAGHALITYSSSQHDAQVMAERALNDRDHATEEKQAKSREISRLEDQSSSTSYTLTRINNELRSLNSRPELSDSDTYQKQKLLRDKSYYEEAIRSLRNKIAASESDLQSIDSRINNAKELLEQAVYNRNCAALAATQTIVAANNSDDDLNDNFFQDIADAIGAQLDRFTTWCAEIAAAIAEGDWDVVLEKLSEAAAVLSEVVGVLSLIFTALSIVFPNPIFAAVAAVLRVASLVLEIAGLGISCIQAVRSGASLQNILLGVVALGVVEIGASLLLRGAGKIFKSVGGKTLMNAVKTKVKTLSHSSGKLGKVVKSITTSPALRIKGMGDSQLFVEAVRNTPSLVEYVADQAKEFVIDKAVDSVDLEKLGLTQIESTFAERLKATANLSVTRCDGKQLTIKVESSLLDKTKDIFGTKGKSWTKIMIPVG